MPIHSTRLFWEMLHSPSPLPVSRQASPLLCQGRLLLTHTSSPNLQTGLAFACRSPGLPHRLIPASRAVVAPTCPSPSTSRPLTAVATPLRAAVATAPAVSTVPARKELLIGGKVTIGGFQLEVTRQLGEGSFGTVWAARPIDGGSEVAIKELRCSSTFTADSAETEERLLREFGGSTGCVPLLLAGESEKIGPSQWAVRFVMQLLPGMLLMEAIQMRRLLPWAGIPAHQRLLLITSYAKELLLQLAPTMARIEERAYHRDAHARNIMVCPPQCPTDTPRFGLIDFGVAVDAEMWRKGAWAWRGAAGDCRYWPLSGWRHFLFDEEGISHSDVLKHEYMNCLDVHSIGLTALQMTLELAMPALAPSPGRDQALDSLLQPLSRLCSHWQGYWDFVSHVWLEVVVAFQTCGHAEGLKEELIRRAVPAVVQSHLKSLHEGLQDLVSAAGQMSSPHLKSLCVEVEGLCEALLLMVGTGQDCPEGASLALDSCLHRRGPGVWGTIQAMLGGEGQLREALPCVSPVPELSRVSKAARVQPPRSLEACVSQTPLVCRCLSPAHAVRPLHPSFRCEAPDSAHAALQVTPMRSRVGLAWPSSPLPSGVRGPTVSPASGTNRCRLMSSTPQSPRSPRHLVNAPPLLMTQAAAPSMRCQPCVVTMPPRGGTGQALPTLLPPQVGRFRAVAWGAVPPPPVRGSSTTLCLSAAGPSLMCTSPWKPQR